MGSRELNAFFLNRRVAVSPAVSHVVDRNLMLAGASGLAGTDDPIAEWRLPDYAEPKALDFLKRHGLGAGGYAVVSPGTIWRTKRWPPDRFAAAVRRLGRERDLPAVVAWAGEEERLAAERRSSPAPATTGLRCSRAADESARAGNAASPRGPVPGLRFRPGSSGRRAEGPVRVRVRADRPRAQRALRTAVGFGAARPAAGMPAVLAAHLQPWRLRLHGAAGRRPGGGDLPGKARYGVARARRFAAAPPMPNAVVRAAVVHGHRAGRFAAAPLMPARTRVARPAPHVNQSVRPPAGARMAGGRTQGEGRQEHGAPEGIRTPDLRLRRPSLYPAELRAREREGCGKEDGVGEGT